MSVRLRCKAVLGAVAAAAIVVSAAAPAGAAPNPYPAAPLDLWGQNGTAYAVEVVGNTAYIGGNFVEAQRYTQRSPRANLMAINLAANPPSNSLSGFNPDANGTVRALVSRRQRCSTSGASSPTSAASNSTVWLGSTSPTGQVDPGFSYNIAKPVRDLVDRQQHPVPGR